MEKFNVKLRKNDKYKPLEFSVQCTCANEHVAEQLVHNEFKNIQRKETEYGSAYQFGNKIEILSVEKIDKDSQN